MEDARGQQEKETQRPKRAERKTPRKKATRPRTGRETNPKGTPKPEPNPKQIARKKPGRTERASMDPFWSAIGQRERLQDTLGKCKTSGPPGTAEVSHFPAPENKSSKNKQNQRKQLIQFSFSYPVGRVILKVVVTMLPSPPGGKTLEKTEIKQKPTSFGTMT